MQNIYRKFNDDWHMSLQPNNPINPKTNNWQKKKNTNSTELNWTKLNWIELVFISNLLKMQKFMYFTNKIQALTHLYIHNLFTYVYINIHMYICKFVSSLLFKLNVTFTKTTTIIYNNLQHCNALMNAASMYVLTILTKSAYSLIYLDR